MNPQPKPQKNETHEARMKENETHHCALVKEAFWERRVMWVESFAFLFVHQYISNDYTVPSNSSSLPEAPVMSEAKGKWSSKKGLSTNVIVAVVIVGLL